MLFGALDGGPDQIWGDRGGISCAGAPADQVGDGGFGRQGGGGGVHPLAGSAHAE